MKATDDDLREALRHHDRRGAARAACPPSDVLARAAEGAATADVADHVARCADCALEYRLASALKAWAEGAAATLLRPARPGLHGSRLLSLALAASLVMSLGLAVWAVSLRQQGDRLEARLAVAQQALRGALGRMEPDVEPVRVGGIRPAADLLPQPLPNVLLVDLFPREASRGVASTVATVDTSDSPFVVLILNVRQPVPGATYAVEIVDASGQAAWSADGVRAGTEPLTLGVPSHLLAGAEPYRVRLHRVRDGRRTLAEQYELRVSAAPRLH